ncbi:uncharacterized protein Triagg1_1474 [Trichoderma aggressivum f. europaeum]|uniref:Uncharacterized protein n=1 Tax=Trichoderma aggressivum f. europaeum TaxID=173218 RepID=A0AAE1M6I5_9HYPO|nr:hypothetical protein Triagg1_1474 [Trichoderma aggressivum f. europaeum]
MPDELEAKQAIFVPTALQAYVVTEDFPQSQARVAPLIQPNYAALRSDSNLLKHDVIEQLNLSSTRLKAKFNTRFVNVASGGVYGQRVGVYLSWCLPRLYRMGSTATDLLSSDEAVLDYEKTLLREGFISHTGEDDALEAGKLKFHHAPNRWLVFRIVQPESDPNGQQSEVFVIESDRIRNVNDGDLRLSHVDIDNLTSPFIHKGLSTDKQYEAVLGLKSRLKDYNPPDNARHRQPFTILDWGNELFADYQPHNSSVFSMFDDLGGIGDANITYYVVGFHHKIKQDSFTIDEPDNSIRPTYQDLLTAGHMELDKSMFQGDVTRDTFLANKADFSTRAICHGALRDVKFRRGGGGNSPLIQPAIKLQQDILKSHPIAVGANIMDALLAYLRVRYHAPAAAQTFNAIDDMLSKMVQLIAGKSTFEAQQQAEDQIASNDWVVEKAELTWTFSNSDDSQKADPGVVDPSKADKSNLAALNSWQACIAGCQREIKFLHHKIFTCWWKAMEVAQNPEKATLRQAYRSEVEAHAKRLELLKSRAREAMTEIETLKAQFPASLHLHTAAAPAFGTHQDPTILFAGVKSGWPTGFREELKVRHSSQLPAPSLESLAARLQATDWRGPGTNEWQSQLSNKFPLVSEMVKKVLPEAIKADAAGPSYPPSYYAEAESNQEAFNNTQGWFPLFMEWEVEYYHIGWENWQFAEDKDGVRRYRLRDDKPLKDIPGASECRTLHGRTMFIPQASQTLKTRIKQLFSRLHPKDLEKQISEEDQAKVIKLVSELEFFSAPLSGIREHMLTLMKGSHVGLSPYDPLALGELGMSEDLVMDISEAAELAPYGKTHRLPTGYIFCPFKPVTHGQFRFTRLDIVDKFGQVVNAVEPADLDLGQPATALYPCLSPLFFCDPIPQDTPFDKELPRPNTAVIPDDLRGVCQFFQVPPRINQPARLNGTYVVNDNGKYRPASSWENPIWGWLVVNYCDSSLQIFNPDGHFLQEIFIHPEDKTAIVSARPKSDAWHGSSERLDKFMALCKQYDYAKGFFFMVAEAAQSTGSNPSEHADFLPAAFGDVLCFVDFGVSMELAEQPYENQSVQRPGKPAKLLEDYEFHVAFGSRNAAYDGFVGYYDLDSGMEDIFSSFGVPREEADSKSPVIRPKPLTMKPYYLRPETPNYGAEHDTKLSIFGAIVDPFRPLHVYTGDVFPMKEISIPKWALDKATKEMHAFFMAGPILVPHVPDPNLVLANTAEVSARDVAIQTPLTGIDEWSWLHPKPKLDENKNPTPDEADWTTMPIRAVDIQLNLSHSANEGELVDGFFIMKKSIKESHPV